MRLIVLFTLFHFSVVNFAQTEIQKTEKHFGFAVNSTGHYSANTVFISPTITFYQKKHQFELGAGFSPFPSDNDRKISTELSYKYFPFGIGNRVNAYIGTNLNYIYLNDFSYPGTYGSGGRKKEYVNLTAGIGAQLRFFKNAYFGLALYGGVATYKKTYSNSLANTEDLFHNYMKDAQIKASIGYRF